MKKWTMTMIFFTSVEFEVKAETYDEAVKKAYEQAVDFPIDTKELDYELEDYEELPDEEEEFEPGRTYVDVMGLNP